MDSILEKLQMNMESSFLWDTLEGKRYMFCSHIQDFPKASQRLYFCISSL